MFSPGSKWRFSPGANSDKYDITKHPNYKYLSDFDKKNAFDVERYMSTRPAIVKPDEAFDIYEIDLSDEDAAAEE